MHAFIAVLSFLIVGAVGVYFVVATFGHFAWVIAAVAAFFLLMGAMAKLNATS